MRKKFNITLLICFAVIALAACSTNNKVEEKDNKIAALEKQVEQLKIENNQVKVQNEQLKKQAEKLSQQLRMDSRKNPSQNGSTTTNN